MTSIDIEESGTEWMNIEDTAVIINLFLMTATTDDLWGITPLPLTHLSHASTMWLLPPNTRPAYMYSNISVEVYISILKV